MKSATVLAASWVGVFLLSFGLFLTASAGEVRAFQSCDFASCLSAADCNSPCCQCEGVTPATYGWCKVCAGN